MKATQFRELGLGVLHRQGMRSLPEVGCVQHGAALLAPFTNTPLTSCISFQLLL